MLRNDVVQYIYLSLLANVVYLRADAQPFAHVRWTRAEKCLRQTHRVRWSSLAIWECNPASFFPLVPYMQKIDKWSKRRFIHCNRMVRIAVKYLCLYRRVYTRMCSRITYGKLSVKLFATTRHRRHKNGERNRLCRVVRMISTHFIAATTNCR